MQLADVARMIARDLQVSYRLLGYINSAFFAPRQPVRSIGQAVALLGVENLSRWALGGVERVCQHRRQAC
jgi:c-di-GMP phosphodiesterase